MHGTLPRVPLSPGLKVPVRLVPWPVLSSLWEARTFSSTATPFQINLNISISSPSDRSTTTSAILPRLPVTPIAHLHFFLRPSCDTCCYAPTYQLAFFFSPLGVKHTTNADAALRA